MQPVYYCSDIPSGLGFVALLVTQIFLWWVDFNAYVRVKQRLFTRPAATSTLAKFMGFLRWVPVKESQKVAPLALACTLVRGVFGVEAEQLSWPHFLRYVSSAGGVERLATIRNGFQETVLDDGAQQICTRLLEEIESCGGRVYTNECVSQCELMESTCPSKCDEVVLHTVASSGVCKKWRAARVVFAVPPTKKAKIHFLGLPKHLRLQAEATLSVQRRRSMGCIIKSVVCYEAAFWLEAGFSGEVICAPTQKAPVFNIYDHTQSGSPKLVCFINGDFAQFWSGEHKRERRKQAVLAQLGSLFGESALTPDDYLEKDWVADYYTGGCPVGCFHPEISDEEIDMLCTPIGPIFWAGTETAESCQGFMSGAVQSGERAARQILQSFVQDKRPCYGNIKGRG